MSQNPIIIDFISIYQKRADIRKYAESLFKKIVGHLNIYGEYITQHFEYSPERGDSSTKLTSLQIGIRRQLSLMSHPIDQKQIVRRKFMEFFDKLWTTIIEALPGMPISMRGLLSNYMKFIEGEDKVRVIMTDLLLGKWWRNYIMFPIDRGIIQKYELNDKYYESSAFVINVLL